MASAGVLTWPLYVSILTLSLSEWLVATLNMPSICKEETGNEICYDYVLFASGFFGESPVAIHFFLFKTKRIFEYLMICSYPLLQHIPGIDVAIKHLIQGSCQ